MKLLLALFVLAAAGAYGWVIGSGINGFSRDRRERDAAQRRYDIESDPDIQSCMHGWDPTE